MTAARRIPKVFQTVTDGLKKLYKSKLLPLEEHYRFHEFHSPALDNADFDNKPMLLLVGQYSTGKTTFIRAVDKKLEEKQYEEHVLEFLKDLEEDNQPFEAGIFSLNFFSRRGLMDIAFLKASK
ncbi:EH domain-containing protein 3-like isoform X1 [Chiloscyllium punctatum]|uniref:EH domain-containing protein 3-like isoform X1 n=1 Tax=Chiloscyllium punctatum TaxID=137246 RepID=UPI003B6379A0